MVFWWQFPTVLFMHFAHAWIGHKHADISAFACVTTIRSNVTRFLPHSFPPISHESISCTMRLFLLLSSLSLHTSTWAGGTLGEASQRTGRTGIPAKKNININCIPCFNTISILKISKTSWVRAAPHPLKANPWTGLAPLGPLKSISKFQKKILKNAQKVPQKVPQKDPALPLRPYGEVWILEFFQN